MCELIEVVTVAILSMASATLHWWCTCVTNTNKRDEEYQSGGNYVCTCVHIPHPALPCSDDSSGGSFIYVALVL